MTKSSFMAFWGWGGSLVREEGGRVNGEIAKGLRKTLEGDRHILWVKVLLSINISQNIQFYSCLKNEGITKIKYTMN